MKTQDSTPKSPATIAAEKIWNKADERAIRLYKRGLVRCCPTISEITTIINEALTSEREEHAKRIKILDRIIDEGIEEIIGLRKEHAKLLERHDRMAAWISRAFGTATHCTAMKLELTHKDGTLKHWLIEASKRHNNP